MLPYAGGLRFSDTHLLHICRYLQQCHGQSVFAVCSGSLYRVARAVDTDSGVEKVNKPFWTSVAGLLKSDRPPFTLVPEYSPYAKCKSLGENQNHTKNTTFDLLYLNHHNIPTIENLAADTQDILKQFRTPTY